MKLAVIEKMLLAHHFSTINLEYAKLDTYDPMFHACSGGTVQLGSDCGLWESDGPEERQYYVFWPLIFSR